MIYEIRAKKYMRAGSTSLKKYYYNRENAEKIVKELNELMDLYYVQEIVCEDEEMKNK